MAVAGSSDAWPFGGPVGPLCDDCGDCAACRGNSPGRRARHGVDSAAGRDGIDGSGAEGAGREGMDSRAGLDGVDGRGGPPPNSSDVPLPKFRRAASYELRNLDNNEKALALTWKGDPTLDLDELDLNMTVDGVARWGPNMTVVGRYTNPHMHTTWSFAIPLHMLQLSGVETEQGFRHIFAIRGHGQDRDRTRSPVRLLQARDSHETVASSPGGPGWCDWNRRHRRAPRGPVSVQRDARSVPYVPRT